MMHPHINQKNKIHLALLAVFIFHCEAQAKCDLYKTPLTRETRCDEYVIEDKKLNFAYRKLMSHLDGKQRKKLVYVQRTWLDWRDERCDEVQREIECGNSICDGVAHDYCIIDLTKNRTKELERFLESTDKGAGAEFNFSKTYRYE